MTHENLIDRTDFYMKKSVIQNCVKKRYTGAEKEKKNVKMSNMPLTYWK